MSPSIASPGLQAGLSQTGGPRPVEFIVAPSSLGLRPNAAGLEPETWRAPEVLLATGLAAQVGAQVSRLAHPAYAFTPQPGTRLGNGRAIRDFSLDLAGRVADARRRHVFPIVLGGDCSVLLGCLLGNRRAGGAGLVHVDGHSDFYHPGNYDTSKRLGSVAGMDLALSTGRGEPLLTDWPDLDGPLVDDLDACQVGERESESGDLETTYGDIASTAITRITIGQLLARGPAAVAAELVGWLGARALGHAWLHVDLDVLDQAQLPAVDSPGSPGLDFDGLDALLGPLVASGRVAGINFTIYDPGLDPGLVHANRIAHSIGRCAAALPARHG
ncbi:arginase [Burkholderia sp. MSh2]|uniref:Arginase n=1 Tax=Burkholderia paludis TaxID=1506587 RepID=A0A6J5ER58_9BURK|nr:MULTISPECIES: arginase family protein [Burkholderia]KEZ07098.1 arginase [Burkholderia sp. MSh2]CAB3768394.1 Formimidoylglutamase [Burkholderia paludis]VWC32346.1 arginase [Burkholderia paludis]